MNRDDAIIFRLLGVPRSAASPMVDYAHQNVGEALAKVRKRLTDLSDANWNIAMGDGGETYRKVWRILEGLV